MEHIVLEYDESTRTALVVATSNKREPVLSGHASPYIVADGYDFESRSWGAGHYFTDIAAAKIDYERSCRHSYPLAEGRLRDDEFCTIRWCREDVATALSEYLSYPIPATKKNIDDVVGQLMAHGSFQDRSIEDGWETISAIIDEDALDLGLSTRQGVDFYRDAFGHWNSTEAIVWPNSEGDAAFVMAVPADSEDGDLAVYKIDACLIGDDEITIDDIERLGGKRELCVYKHGFDGIEAIRNFANRVAVDRFDERFVVNNLYGELPDLAPTLRKVTEGARTAAQEPRDPQAIAAAALSAAEGGANGAVEHVGNKHDDVAGCALIAGAVDGVVPAIDGHNTPYVVAMGYDHPTRNWEDCTLFDDIVKAKLAYEGLRGREYPLDGAMRRDDSDTLDIRALTDAELAIEIEKAGAAMVEHVDAHMAHVHGLGGGEGDSAAYYAARKRHADLRLEKDRRLHASIDLGQREGPREPQAMAAAAAKAALNRDGAELGRGGKKQ